MLTTAQRAALEHVRRTALRDRPAALAAVARVLAHSGVAHRPEELIAAIGRHGRLTVNFHPDRLRPDGRTVAEALLAEGVYRSQFVTGISNGGLTAYPVGTGTGGRRPCSAAPTRRPGCAPPNGPSTAG